MTEREMYLIGCEISEHLQAGQALVGRLLQEGGGSESARKHLVAMADDLRTARDMLVDFEEAVLPQDPDVREKWRAEVPLTIEGYLSAKGLTRAEIEAKGPEFALRLRDAYIAERGVEPPTRVVRTIV